MKKIVAFVANLSQEECNQWLNEINSRLVDIKVVMIEDLNVEQKKQVQVAIVANPDPGKLLQLPNLKWVQSLWAGVEKLLQRFPNENFKISRMVDPMLSMTMAEAVLAWVLYLHRDMPQYKNQQNKKIWQQRELIQAQDRKVGILGLGKLGSICAEKLCLNDFSVLGWSNSPKKIEGVESFSGKKGFQEMLKLTDILVCLLPLTLETHNILNKDSLRHLNKGASLINFSRGLIINENDLLEFLNESRLNHAVLDVFATEPLPSTSPLWDSDKITLLPHISAPTNLQSASKIVSESLSQYFKTGELPEVINSIKGY